ncbi:MAG TPA: CcmD family protein [Polyangiaceae bacterium]|nr:CcmD family protein [Polyangiaceae bacterium]
MSAQPAEQPKTAATADPGDRSEQFVAVQGGGETTSAEALLVSAYIVIWLLLLGFVWLTWKRQRGIEARLGDLEKALQKSARE